MREPPKDHLKHSGKSGTASWRKRPQDRGQKMLPVRSQGVATSGGAILWSLLQAPNPAVKPAMGGMRMNGRGGLPVSVCVQTQVLGRWGLWAVVCRA